MKKMVSRGFKQDRNLAVAFCKRRDFLWYNKSNVSIYEKNYLGKMQRIQMLINPSLPFVVLPPSKKNSRKVLRNIADIFKDFELFILYPGGNLSYSERPKKSKDK